MSLDHVTIFIGLTAALLAMGAARVVLWLFNRDRRRLKSRLAGDTRARVEEVMTGRSVVRQTAPAGLPALAARSRFLRRLHGRLVSVRPGADLRRLLMLCAAAGLAASMMVMMLVDSVAVALACGAAAAYVPAGRINGIYRRRQRILADQLPDALDFLTRVLRAGHSLSTGIQTMGEELPAPIGEEFRNCYAQHSLGQPLEHALRDMVARVESPDFAFFVTAVLIQRQTGGDLTEVLNNISGMIRNRIRLQQRVKAVTAEGRITGYILTAFPAVLLAITWLLNPGYAGALFNTDMGRTMLGAAVVLQALGLVAIRRIVTVKV